VQVKFAVRNIRRNRRRSLVAISTIAVGVAGLLFLQGFFSGLLAMHAENAIHSRHGHGQVMTKGYFEQTFESPMEHWITDPQPVLTKLRSLPQVKEAFPRVQFFALLSNGKVNVAGKGQGIIGAREREFFDKMNFVAGGPIGDEKEGIVLGLGLACSLGVSPGDRVTVLGQTVNGTVNAIDTVVTGIFHVGMKEADDMLFQVQLDQAQLLMDSDKIETIAVGLHKDGDWQAVEKEMAASFAGLEALSVYRIDQAWAENGRLFLTALMNIFRLTFLGMIILAIYNSAANTVLERKRELGMLRANGESVRDLVLLLVTEGLVLSLLGAAAGIVILYVLWFVTGDGLVMPPTPGTNRALPVQLDIQFWHLMTGAALGVVASTLATLLSTAQVMRLSIVQALRSPA
jgi:putative ABC transport system permease protein